MNTVKILLFVLVTAFSLGSCVVSRGPGWVPGHYDYGPYGGRHWVPGHYR